MKHDLYENGGRRLARCSVTKLNEKRARQSCLRINVRQSLLNFRIFWKIVQMVKLKMERSELTVELNI